MDNAVTENDQNRDFLNLCDKENVFICNLTGNEKHTCKKILRNFILCNSVNRDDFFHCCCNLYVWLYFEIKKYKISNVNIKKIFDLHKLTEYSGIKYNPCSYITFNDGVKNPEDLMKLNIFNDNAGTFYSTLKDSNESKDCDLKKYVYECVDIYNNIKKNHSFSYDCSISPHESACTLTYEFNDAYTRYILNKPETTHKFPKLSSDTPLDVIDGCPLKGTESKTVPEETQQDTLKTGGVSTALSAMVGIPPFLALIYKVNIIRT
ncbi:hypothetical protein PVBG_05186 [Plasmodium vivax Brazil I]|uniref:Uncharacterized protein n=1 Tax=Plasmodium vivax (strain Brazil I) TaxID=1033975 RepID=A0A0J9SKN1_PLAV1|nr:hypothetical protein PVBG_05186 [Plasmodium vivax Brazil I]